MGFCAPGAEHLEKLPQSGLWTNYKYPLYLRDMRSARFVQDQIYISSIKFKEGDSLVWLQFRLRDWKPFKPTYMGGRKWLLHQDSSDMAIPLELTLNNNGLHVANDMFQLVSQGNVLGTAFSFYADEYENGEENVSLNDTGDIIGLDTFVAYQPIVDYAEEPGKGDLILFRSSSGIWVKFGLAISDWDALEIYEINQGKKGKKIYHLKRKLKPLFID